MSIRQGSKILAGVPSRYHPDLFDWKWADHICNDVQWLRADTFSWQSGSVYEAAYQHLTDDCEVAYAYRNSDNTVCWLRTRTPQVGDSVYNNWQYTTDPVATIATYDESTQTITLSGWRTGTFTRFPYSDKLGVMSSETIGGTTIQFYLADDGHKICPASEESNVAAIYTATGVAWYYIIDTENEQFKLPRTKFGVTGLRDTVGNYVAPGLPNITGTITQGYGTWRTLTATGALGVSGSCGTQAQGESGSSTLSINIDASRSSSIYGNSTTVQPPATQMYLYFYVGKFTQTALENTAGLNAELFNDKLDNTVSHVVQTYTNGTSWYRLYSDGWCEQGGLATVGTGGTGTVNFLKPFINTDYYFGCDVGRRADSSTWIIYPASTYSTTSQGLKSNLTGYTLYSRWRACGYVS